MHSLPFDKSSVIAQLKLRISELQSRFTSGGGECIPVPDSAGSSYATAPPGDPPPGLAALPQVQPHDHGQDPPPPPDRMFPATERDRARGFEGPFSDFERGALDKLHAQDDAGLPPNDDQDMDDGPLHITYTTATQRPSRTAPADPHGDPSSSSSSFPDMPCMKRVYRDEKALFHWSAARNKERFSPR